MIPHMAILLLLRAFSECYVHIDSKQKHEKIKKEVEELT